MAEPRWLALESNPDVMNKYVTNLGLDTSSWQYVDVYGLDPDLLMMVPKPVCALLLLFPISESYEKFRLEEEVTIKKEGQVVSEKVYFTTQTVRNACGTVGIIHSIANNLDELNLKDGHLKSFIAETQSLSPKEKAEKLETNEGITQCHGDSALEGQTQAPPIDEKVNLHFIALVHKDGYLYELDGSKPFPINHGKSSPDSFLEDAVRVCKVFMDRDPTMLQFNMVALSKTD